MKQPTYNPEWSEQAAARGDYMTVLAGDSVTDISFQEPILPTVIIIVLFGGLIITWIKYKD